MPNYSYGLYVIYTTYFRLLCFSFKKHLEVNKLTYMYI